MRNFILVGLLLFVHAAYSQNIARVIEYRPAPGQHINIEQIGTSQAAQNMAENESSLISLGSFGGYAVLKFDQPCSNDSENPYGIDFTVFGNAFSGSSEPGIIWVMKDENQNGEPDDTWYEIAGSHHFHSATERSNEITYYKTSSRDVLWKDKKGNSGTIEANSFNTQEYYPTAANFPEYPVDSVSFSGTKLHVEIAVSGLQELSIPTLDFGYADNHPKMQGVSLTLPDNPYSSEIEGAGGDPIDISWAVDSLGSYVDLNEIDFVKITTAYLADLGRLGEASTDVSYVVDVESNDIIAERKDLLVVYFPPTQMLLGDTTFLESNLFNAGRRVAADFQFTSSNAEIIRTENTGELIALKLGTTEVQVSAQQEIKNLMIEVVVPGAIAIDADLSAVYPGDTILLSAQVYDNNGDYLNLPTEFSHSNPAVGEIIQKDGEFFFVAKNPGETTLSCSEERFGIQQNRTINVLSVDDKIKVYFTLKTENENLFPRQWIEVGMADINSFVESRQQDYSEVNRLTLAHALLGGMNQADVNFTYRDDDSSAGELYLHSVESEGLFSYGWGGQTEPADYARAWIARLNGLNYLNDFDAIEIADGDTVELYHIAEINLPWQFSRLTANKDSAVAGESVEILAEETICMLQNDTISETRFLPLQNQEIIAGESFFTDENGVVEIILDSNSPWIFSAGSEAILIHEKTTTGLFSMGQSEIHVYPNPVTQVLHVDGLYVSGAEISVLNASGSRLLERKLGSNHVSLNVNDLAPGIYFLRIDQGGLPETIKFIKK